MRIRRWSPLVLAAALGLSVVALRPAQANLFGDRKPDEFQGEQEMFSLINQARKDKGLTKLSLDSQLRRDARDNSDDMASSEELRQPSASGVGVCSAVGRSAENSTSVDHAMKQVFKLWMQPGTKTRACILDRLGRTRFGGVGVKRGDAFVYWVTFIAARSVS